MKRESTRVGRRFGRLVVQARDTEATTSGIKFICACDCGNTTSVLWKNLSRGSTKSCGCYRDELIGALVAEKAARQAAKPPKPTATATHPLYQTWRGMIRRCYRAANDNYKFYGGRGITVCDRWRTDFWAFVEDMGDRPAGHTLDRVNSDGNYEPGNVRWADKLTQYSNIRGQGAHVATIKGKTMFATDWAKRFGVKFETVKKLIKAGLSPELALVTAAARKKEWERTGGVGADYAGCQAKAEAWLRKHSH